MNADIKTAEQMAKEQREISVAEFFEKNRHLLGFDNPMKALMIAVKEMVDNSLDACQEAGILPEVTIKIRELSEDRARVSVEDNGPGIVKEQIPRVFGKLLYGSKFYKMRQGRGQQGIGVSAALLYSQLTTGKPAIVISRTSKSKPAHEMHIRIDTSKNEPEVIKSEKFEGNFNDHGTYVEMEMEGKYRKGERSVDEFIKQTAIANPFAKFIYHVNGEKITYSRLIEQLPKSPKQIKPHPQGVEMGVFEKMIKLTKGRTIAGFLSGDFTRVGPGTAKEILKLSKVNPNTKPDNITREEMEKIWR
ncbi:MAG: DNA topoisomerase VI subunit B, partial [Candidatus Aenigmarchaeota archaeon]|nr:DNA topoisomerase VI subunit B [Candidatus Aenigmarchaeota archaeon]